MFKYIHIAKTSFLSRAFYRFELLFDAIKAVVVVLVITAVWKEIYSNKDQLGEYNLMRMISYTCIASTLALLFNVDIARYFSAKIHRGNIAVEFIKPINYFIYCFSEHLGAVLYSLIFFAIPTFAILMVAFGLDIFMSVKWPEFFITTVLGFFLYYLFCHLCGLTTFYTVEAWGIEYFRINLLRFFAGGFIPISLFPSDLRTISSYLPFEYMIYVPSTTIAGTFNNGQLGQVVLIQVVWIAMLFLMNQIFWMFIVRKVTVHGG